MWISHLLEIFFFCLQKKHFTPAAFGHNLNDKPHPARFFEKVLPNIHTI